MLALGVVGGPPPTAVEDDDDDDVGGARWTSFEDDKLANCSRKLVVNTLGAICGDFNSSTLVVIVVDVSEVEATSGSSSSGRLGILYLPNTLDLRWKEAGSVSPNFFEPLSARGLTAESFAANDEDVVIQEEAAVESAFVLTDDASDAGLFAAVVSPAADDDDAGFFLAALDAWSEEPEGRPFEAEEEEIAAAAAFCFFRRLPESRASWKISREEGFSDEDDDFGSLVFSGAINRCEVTLIWV